MTHLKLNREFFVRHLGVTLLMVGLGCWFGYDGFVAYPKHPESYFTERHLQKDNAIKRQKEFMVLAFLAALVVGAHLRKVASFKFAYDGETYVFNGQSHRIADIKNIDRSHWAKKSIVKIDGITLDAWHHTGVKEFEKILPVRG